MLLIEASQPFKFRDVGASVFGLGQRLKQEESLLLVASINQHYEAQNEVHALAVANLMVIN